MRVQELTPDTRNLTLSKGRKHPTGDSVDGTSNVSIEDSMSGDIRLKVQLQISRMNEMRTFFNHFTETVQSGPRNELALLITHLYFPLIAQKNGMGSDVVSALSLDDLRTVMQDITRDSDDLKAVVRTNSSSSFGKLEDPHPVYSSIQSNSKSFIPTGATDVKKEMFHWVLSRQLGPLRPMSMVNMHILHPTDFHCRLTRTSSSWHRKRGPFNIRFRWYSFRAYRILIEKYFDSLKKPS
ncbi:hypothetical protein BKA64DRAFT_675984 [Cadophora sp. MPI-SDFR-AT-0126]|nr:hypothetical protein BKA64DRAFT_675984 [Leotiomycetes sp. MPI-SDFR-AT-0126]